MNAGLRLAGTAVAFSPDGSLLFSAGQNGILNADTGERLRLLLRLDFIASTVVYSPNGDHIAVAYSDGAVRLWNARTGVLERVLTTPPYRSTVQRNQLIYSPDGTLLTSEAPTAAFRWDVSSGQQVWSRLAEVTVGHRHLQIPCEAVSPDSGTLARAGQARGLIELRSATTGELLHFLTHPEPRGVMTLVFSPNGRVLAAGYETFWVRLWDVETGELLQSLEAAADDITAIAFSPNSNFLAAGGNYDPKVDLFDLRLCHSRTCALLGIGKPEASNSEGVDGEMKPESGPRPTVRLADHVGHITSIAYAPDGHTVATVASDATLNLWDPATGRLRATLLPLPAPDDTSSEDWIGYTPEGYYHGSPGAEQFLRWSVNGVHFPAELHAAARAGADHLRHALATPREEETNTHGHHVGAD
jgi:WD40 repeat protein